MAMKKIRLTESELTRLVRRIVEDSEEIMSMGDDMGMEMDDVMDGNEMTKQEVIDLISDFFKDEVLPELTPREKNSLKRKVETHRSPRMHEEDETNNLKNRMSDFREKTMIRGGLAGAAVGAIGALGEFMGWSEFETLSKIHEYVESFGAGNYSGPITVTMVAAGLALALKGADMRYRRMQK